MIALGFHYFTDTIAGAAVGAGTVVAIALVLDLPRPRRWLAVADGWAAQAANIAHRSPRSSRSGSSTASRDRIAPVALSMSGCR